MKNNKTKTLYEKGVLIGVDPIRVDFKYYGGKRCKLFIFTCLGHNCYAELVLTTSSAFKTHTGRCRSCSQRGKPFEASYNELCNRSPRHGHEVSITYDEYYKICLEDECHYCLEVLGRTPYTKKEGRDVPKSRAYMLDRMDNSLGYSSSNVVGCCWKCNAGRGSRYSYDEWFGMTEYFRNLKT